MKGNYIFKNEYLKNPIFQYVKVILMLIKI